MKTSNADAQSKPFSALSDESKGRFKCQCAFHLLDHAIRKGGLKCGISKVIPGKTLATLFESESGSCDLLDDEDRANKLGVTAGDDPIQPRREINDKDLNC